MSSLRLVDGRQDHNFVLRAMLWGDNLARQDGGLRISTAPSVPHSISIQRFMGLLLPLGLVLHLKWERLMILHLEAPPMGLARDVIKNGTGMIQMPATWSLQYSEGALHPKHSWCGFVPRLFQLE